MGEMRMVAKWEKLRDTGTAEGRRNDCGNIMLVGICGTDEEGREPWGEIIHGSLIKPVPYRGLAELEFRMDEIARFLKLPSDTSPCRTLPGSHGGGMTALPEEYRKEGSAGWRSGSGFRQGMCRKRPRELVRVELLGRYHMSLQGRVRCRSTGEREICFRSALELMYLFSEIVQDMKNVRFKNKESGSPASHAGARLR